MLTKSEPVWNWARDGQLGTAAQLCRPESVDELRHVLANHHGSIRLLGSRLSPGRMLESPDGLLLDMTGISGLLDLDDDTATFAGGTTLDDIHTTLTRMGRALDCAPGVIAPQTLAGAMSTGTHGQGLRQSSIPDAAVAIEFLDASGTPHRVAVGDDDFPALQVGLGVVGVITSVTMRTVDLQIYALSKRTVTDYTLEDDLLAWNRDHEYSKTWWYIDDSLVHVWNASPADLTHVSDYHAGGDELLDIPSQDQHLDAAVDRMLQRLHADIKTTESNERQSKTLNRFRDGGTSVGDVYQLYCRGIALPQINMEIGVPLERAPEVIRRLRRWHDENDLRLHYPVTLRCTGASSSWLSPASGTPTCFFGLVVYYADDYTLSQDALAAMAQLEDILVAAGGRPHWGKHYRADKYDFPALYPQWDAFWAVRDRYDPTGVFTNEHVGELLKTRVRG